MARKMPPHVVLPNGMWRFVKRGSKASSSKARSKKRRAAGGQMGKKKGYRGGGGKGGKILGLSTKGLLIGGLGILGVAAGALYGDQIAQMIQQKTGFSVPLGGYGVALAVGGPAAVAGKFVASGMGGSSASNSALY